MALACAAAVLLAACDRGATRRGDGRAVTGEDRFTGSLTVFAAASLTEAFTDVETKLEADNENFDLTYSFGGSGALITQIEQGAPADVVATADETQLDALRDKGWVEQPVTLAGNRLEILVAKGNPKHIAGLADLGRPDVLFVAADGSVPAGKYAMEALRRAGVTVAPKSRELDVKAAAGKVIVGEADATIVYVTDVRAAGARAEGIAIPDAQNVTARYGIAVVARSRHRQAARAFVDYLVRGAGQHMLRRRGFVGAT